MSFPRIRELSRHSRELQIVQTYAQAHRDVNMLQDSLDWSIVQEISLQQQPKKSAEVRACEKEHRKRERCPPHLAFFIAQDCLQMDIRSIWRYQRYWSARHVDWACSEHIFENAQWTIWQVSLGGRRSFGGMKCASSDWAEAHLTSETAKETLQVNHLHYEETTPPRPQCGILSNVVGPNTRCQTRMAELETNSIHDYSCFLDTWLMALCLQYNPLQEQLWGPRYSLSCHHLASKRLHKPHHTWIEYAINPHVAST